MPTLDLDTLVLRYGSHAPDSQMCLLEAVAYINNEPWTDAPKCVSPVLAAFGRAWNDGMRSHAEREQLKQYIPLLPGTVASPAVEQQRSFMACDWLIRTYSVTWLRLAKLDKQAQVLIDLPPPSL